jgi:hypothetical protein
MRTRRRRDRAGAGLLAARAAAAVLLAAACHCAARANGRSVPPAPAAPGTPFERAILAAFADAAARLAGDPCLQVLGDFRDRAGVTLSARLGETGTSASEYVRRLAVADGDNHTLCQARNVLAGTRPGSRLVFFCFRRFSRVQFFDPDLAAAVVIHEALHSLGLPENPPTSQEITDRVLARCRR